MPAPVLTIDLDAIAGNWRALDRIAEGAETAAAVKANAYGCGIARVAPVLSRAGCRTFFVATPDEGVELRGTLPDATIYILNGCDASEVKKFKNSALQPCLNSASQFDAWQSSGGGPFALQLDSGMSRLGLPDYELRALTHRADARGAFTACTLILSHLANADEPEARENIEQRDAFDAALRVLVDIAPDAKHSLGATGGTLLGGAFRHDLLRCGIGLYGGLPFEKAQPVVSLHAPILQVRDIPAGAFVGYGASWRAERPSRIATLPLGYADGMHRSLSNAGRGFINGAPAPLVGRVSMDLITLDVTDHPEVEAGTMVEFLGPHQSIDMLANAAGTIGYEILTSLGSRYERRYKGGGSA